MALGLGAENLAEQDSWDPKKGKRKGQNWWTDTLDTLNPFASTEDIDRQAEENWKEGLRDKFSLQLSELNGVQGVDLSITGSTTVQDLRNRLTKAAKIKSARDGYVAVTGDRSAVSGILDPAQIEQMTFKANQNLLDQRDEKNHQRTVQTQINAEDRSQDRWEKQYKIQQEDNRAAQERLELREDRKDLRQLRAQLADREAARADRKEARADEYRMRQEELDAKIFSTELNHIQAMQSEKNRVEDRKMQAQAMIMKALGSIGQAFAI